MAADRVADAREWQRDVWDRVAAYYRDEVDPLFGPVIAGVVERAQRD